jgi:hypothetical protein
MEIAVKDIESVMVSLLIPAEGWVARVKNGDEIPLVAWAQTLNPAGVVGLVALDQSPAIMAVDEADEDFTGYRRRTSPNSGMNEPVAKRR